MNFTLAFHKDDLPLNGSKYTYDANNDGLNDVIFTSSHSYGIWWIEQLSGGGWTTHVIDYTLSQDVCGQGSKNEKVCVGVMFAKHCSSLTHLSEVRQIIIVRK